MNRHVNFILGREMPQIRIPPCLLAAFNATPIILNVVLFENLCFSVAPPKFAVNPTHLDPTPIKAQKTTKIGEIDAGTTYDWSILGVATLRRLR